MKAQHLINREISWLAYNYRVLQEAMDVSTPLMERLKFIGIFSGNLEEFYSGRVGAHKHFLNTRKNHANTEAFYGFEQIIDSKNTLQEIDKVVKQQNILFNQCYEQLAEELKREQIYFINEKQLDEEQKLYVKRYFNEQIHPHLIPLLLNYSENVMDKLSDNEIHLLALMSSSLQPSHFDTAIITVPTQKLGRFIFFPSDFNKNYIMFLEDAVKYCIKDIFNRLDFDVFHSYIITFTRDAEFAINADLLTNYTQALELNIQQRRKGALVRLNYDSMMPNDVIAFIMKKLKINKEDTIISAERYHNFKDFINFPLIENSKLYFQSLKEIKHVLLKNGSIFAELKKKDILLHYPYYSFCHIIELLQEASLDKNVVAIDMTFYRVATNSSVVNALIGAARNGKKVRVYMELRARLDENKNFNTATQLSDEGIQIIPILPKYKVHAKIFSIRRKEYGKINYYTNISTGNFNEETAPHYVDESFLTSDFEIGKEVEIFFDMLQYQFQIPTFKKLVVSPFDTRKFMLKKIQKEIQAAKAGLKSEIILKINALSDPIIIKALYRASNAGVKVNLIIRGICSLRAGIEGLSDNIQVTSIVGRFLEHARIFYFNNGGKPLYFISSSDMMPRNLDNRLEVTVPVTDPELCKELHELLLLQIGDTVKARQMLQDGSYQYKQNQINKINAQEGFALFITSKNVFKL